MMLQCNVAGFLAGFFSGVSVSRKTTHPARKPDPVGVLAGQGCGAKNDLKKPRKNQHPVWVLAGLSN